MRRNLSTANGLHALRAPSILAALFLLCLASCPLPDEEYPVSWAEASSFFDWLHGSELEGSWDGAAAGTWGVGRVGTPLPLRSVYWPVEAYGRLARTAHPAATQFGVREEAGIAYLKRVQGANGCWGIPANPAMPEFGAAIQEVIDMDGGSGTYVRDGWIVDLPVEKRSELYYDHGRSLTTLSRHYLRDAAAHADDLPSIVAGADWAAAMGPSADHNVNYDASLVEGLSWAYRATGEGSYRDAALSLAESAIYPFRNADGSYGDAHNALLRYHGFTLGALEALAGSLDDGPDRATALDHLATARAYLAAHLRAADPRFDLDAVGIDIRVYGELEDLIASGIIPALTTDEEGRINFLRMECVESQDGLFADASLSAYARVKAQWHFCQLGVAVAAFHFDG